MLNIKTSSIRPGMKLCKPIYSNEGQLLIDNGVVLKESYIKKLKNYNINSVFIKWDTNESSEVVEAIIKDTRKAALSLLKQSIYDIECNKNINIEKMREVVSNIIEELLNKRGTLINLTSIRSVDDYTFIHSINVCILSLVMGISLGYNKEELACLGIGSILHDIGKFGIEPVILKKPGTLTPHEYEIVKNHSLIGYELVKDLDELTEQSITIIRDHHERYDGKGYPSGKKGTEISEYARIVAVCDVYDALTSNRVYRLGMPPHIGIEYLINMGNHQFDYNMVKLFIKHISLYPKGTLVELESGEKGIVVKVNEDFPTRPIIDVLFDENGRDLETPVTIDLTQITDNGIKSELRNF